MSLPGFDYGLIITGQCWHWCGPLGIPCMQAPFSLIPFRQCTYTEFHFKLWTTVSTKHASYRPEILKMEELNDNTELLLYSSATLYLLSGVTPPREYIELVADQFITTIKTTSVSRFTVFHLFDYVCNGWPPKKYIFVYPFLFYIFFSARLLCSHGKSSYTAFRYWSSFSIETWSISRKLVSQGWWTQWSLVSGTRMLKYGRRLRNSSLGSCGAHNGPPFSPWG